MALTFLFRRLVFALVLLGIASLCMAEENPALLLIAGAIAALSWYVVEGPTGRPLPQWVILPCAMLALAWLLPDLFVWQHGNVVLAMGHFIMWLQILLLYARKTNREYAQLLGLSVMQMVSAGVLTSSLIFGLLLGVYCLVALFAVLLFQFKVTADKVAAAQQAGALRTAEPANPKPVVGPGHRWQFRLSALAIGASCFLVAVVVFLATPRADRSFIRTDFGEQLGVGKLVGFSPYIQLNGQPVDPGDESPVLNVKLSINGTPVSNIGQSWRLRGVPLDIYSPLTHIWSRSGGDGAHAGIYRFDRPIEVSHRGIHLAPTPPKTPVIEATVTMRMSADQVLFTLNPVSEFQSDTVKVIDFNGFDQYLAAMPGTALPFTYRVQSPMELPSHFFEGYGVKGWPLVRQETDVDTATLGEYASGWTADSDQVRRWTLNILAKSRLSRDPHAESTPDDLLIARFLMRYLRDNYHYSLTSPPASRRQDPITDFLMLSHQGHCEYFAAGLAAALRSIGMHARVVSGFLVNEYNPLGGYYVVRQSDAHAWTEAWCGPEVGWVTLDSTPAAAVAQEHQEDRGKMEYLRAIYEYMEFTWVNHVVAYDDADRHRLLRNAADTLETLARDQNSWLGRTITWVRSLPAQFAFDSVVWTVIGVILFFIGVGLLTLTRLVLVRARRLAALQLNRLPRKQQRRLAGRLRFYLQMLDLLERQGHIRPEWQSPFSFAMELAQANPQRFEPVVALTEIFYEIRFGHRDLDAERHAKVRGHLRRLDAALAGRKTAKKASPAGGSGPAGDIG